MGVISRGRIGVYPPRGEYQIILDYLEPLGVGALALAFEQLKRKLAAQGVFDEARKRPLPFLPQRVAVITSPTGAAIRDFLKVIRRRFANLEIIVVPVRVQGEGAAGEIIDALEVVNRDLKADVIVMTRGGGSLEDLWAFNAEELALAIRASRIPVVSAVGHEIDVTISDLAADLRAPTPSAAAELLVTDKEALKEKLEETERRLLSGMKAQADRLRQGLLSLSRVLRDPGRKITEGWLRLDGLTGRAIRLAQSGMAERRRALAGEARALLLGSPENWLGPLKQKIHFQRRTVLLEMMRQMQDRGKDLLLLKSKIEDLSPLSVLKRGYSITRKMPEEKVLAESAGVERGDKLNIIFATGEVNCEVEEVREGVFGRHHEE
jgi:exodeoxyribonuclease VII large subunit